MPGGYRATAAVKWTSLSALPVVNRVLQSELVCKSFWRVARLCIAFFARACPELAEGVGGDAAGATFVRSTLPVVDAVAVPAFFAYAKDGAPAAVVALQFEGRATRLFSGWAANLFCLHEGRGTRSCGGYCSLKAGPAGRSTPRDRSVAVGNARARQG